MGWLLNPFFYWYLYDFLLTLSPKDQYLEMDLEDKHFNLCKTYNLGFLQFEE